MCMNLCKINPHHTLPQLIAALTMLRGGRPEGNPKWKRASFYVKTLQAVGRCFTFNARYREQTTDSVRGD